MFVVKILCASEGVAWTIYGKRFPERLQAEEQEDEIWTAIEEDVSERLKVIGEEGGSLSVRRDAIKTTEVCELMENVTGLGPVNPAFKPRVVEN